MKPRTTGRDGQHGPTLTTNNISHVTGGRRGQWNDDVTERGPPEGSLWWGSSRRPLLKHAERETSGERAPLTGVRPKERAVFITSLYFAQVSLFYSPAHCFDVSSRKCLNSNCFAFVTECPLQLTDSLWKVLIFTTFSLFLYFLPEQTKCGVSLSFL